MNDVTEANSTFEPLQALSFARTALDDPAAIFDDGAQPNIPYAIDRIDEVIGALRFEGSNDYAGEARWVLTHLGRLLAAVAEKLEAEADEGLDVGAKFAAVKIQAGLDYVDEAINAL